MKEIKSKDWLFKPGEGGRPKGALNKVTANQKERVEWVLALLDDTLEEDIRILKAEKRVELWSILQEFIRPKLQRMNVDITPVEDRITKITFEVVEAGMISEANIKTLPIGEDIEGIRSIPEKL